MEEDKPERSTKVTEDRVDDVIAQEAYYRFPGTTMTVCLLTLKNGYQVIGESACPREDFDDEYGRRLARKRARSKIFELEGYSLRSERMKTDTQTEARHEYDTAASVA